jgi:hypothetical protein
MWALLPRPAPTSGMGSAPVGHGKARACPMAGGRDNSSSRALHFLSDGNDLPVETALETVIARMSTRDPILR